MRNVANASIGSQSRLLQLQLPPTIVEGENVILQGLQMNELRPTVFACSHDAEEGESDQRDEKDGATTHDNTPGSW